MTHSFGKVWAGSYGANHLIINGVSVEPVAFQEDDAGGELCAALNAAGVAASIQDGSLEITSENELLVEGHLPNGSMPNGFAAIPDLDGGAYT